MKKIFCILLCIAAPVSAAEISLTASQQPSPGENVKITAHLSTTGESVNAIEGLLAYPSHFELQEIRDGNSIINFWIERPNDTGTAVRFAGIVPGGYTGDSGELFELIFTAAEATNAHFGLFEGRAYRNDGDATAVPLSLSPATEIIEDSLALEDHIPPEPFVPSWGSDATLFDGHPFIAFATQDKQSGISHYEVAEAKGWRRFAPMSMLKWQRAESPYPVSDTNVIVYVRAIDKEGNAFSSGLSPDGSPLRYNSLLYLGILLVLGGIAFAVLRFRTSL